MPARPAEADCAGAVCPRCAGQCLGGLVLSCGRRACSSRGQGHGFRARGGGSDGGAQRARVGWAGGAKAAKAVVMAVVGMWWVQAPVARNVRIILEEG